MRLDAGVREPRHGLRYRPPPLCGWGAGPGLCELEYGTHRRSVLTLLLRWIVDEQIDEPGATGIERSKREEDVESVVRREVDDGAVLQHPTRVGPTKIR